MRSTVACGHPDAIGCLDGVVVLPARQGDDPRGLAGLPVQIDHVNVLAGYDGPVTLGVFGSPLGDLGCILGGAGAPGGDARVLADSVPAGGLAAFTRPGAVAHGY